MRKQVAIITGASGGIGREFTRLVLRENIDEIWAIARNREKLDALKKDFGDKIIAISQDLGDADAMRSLADMLRTENPVVAYLINNAGIARMGLSQDFPAEEISATLSVHCYAMAALCSTCIPYMEKGSRILNISSVASFQPLPYLNLYAAAKVFQRSYSRSLHQELKSRGITSTAVCPGWVDTELLSKEINGRNVRFHGLVSADKVALQALRDAKSGRDMSVCTLFAKWEHLLAKLLPQRVYMRMWMLLGRKYLKTA